jgi:hypothetical protein
LLKKVRDDLEFVQKVFELEEYERAEKMCREVLARLADTSGEAEVTNSFRSLLIDTMIARYDSDDLLEPILEELESLFIAYLTIKDRTSAAKTLLRRMEFLGGLDWPRSFETGFKLLELFGATGDKELLEVVRETFNFLYVELPVEDPRFASLCVAYGRLLERREFDCYEGLIQVMEMDDALNGENNAKAIQILESFLLARSEDISMGDREWLESRLASNYLFVGDNGSAIGACCRLLARSDNDASRLDWTLWCGQAFMNLGRHKTAAMFFREVIRACADKPDDSRAVEAGGFLDDVEDTEELDHP